MIAQNFRLDELYHAEASNLTFRNKRCAYVQTCDGGEEEILLLTQKWDKFLGSFTAIFYQFFSILNYTLLGMFGYQDH